MRPPLDHGKTNTPVNQVCVRMSWSPFGGILLLPAPMAVHLWSTLGWSDLTVCFAFQGYLFLFLTCIPCKCWHFPWHAPYTSCRYMIQALTRLSYILNIGICLRTIWAVSFLARIYTHTTYLDTYKLYRKLVTSGWCKQNYSCMSIEWFPVNLDALCLTHRPSSVTSLVCGAHNLSWISSKYTTKERLCVFGRKGFDFLQPFTSDYLLSTWSLHKHKPCRCGCQSRKVGVPLKAHFRI